MKILIRSNDTIYKFLRLEVGKEGSVYFFLDRATPKQEKRFSGIPGRLVEVPQTGEQRKLSYHLTGRVNYGGFITEKGCNFFEPLLAIHHENHVLWVSVPRVDKLDEFEGAEAEHCTIDVRNLEGSRFTVGIAVMPKEATTELHGVAIALGSHPALQLLIYRAPDPEAPSADHFVYLKPPTLYEQQVIPRYEAELAYIKGEESRNEIAVAGPNGEGDYTLYFAVVMRAPPKVKVELFDPQLQFELRRNDQPHRLTFRIKGPQGLIRSADLSPIIKSIELDAEL